MGYYEFSLSMPNHKIPLNTQILRTFMYYISIINTHRKPIVSSVRKLQRETILFRNHGYLSVIGDLKLFHLFKAFVSRRSTNLIVIRAQHVLSYQIKIKYMYVIKDSKSLTLRIEYKTKSSMYNVIKTS